MDVSITELDGILVPPEAGDVDSMLAVMSPEPRVPVTVPEIASVLSVFVACGTNENAHQLPAPFTPEEDLEGLTV